jgi:hypothetical protein
MWKRNSLVVLLFSLVCGYSQILDSPLLLTGGSTTGGTTGGGTPTFRSASFVGGTAANATPSEPAGAADNDILVSFAISRQDAGALSIPSGWTSIYSGQTGSGSVHFFYNLAWIRRSGAPALTWTTPNTYREVYVLAYSGCTTSGSPIDASQDGGSTTTTNPDCPSITTVTANAMVLAIAGQWSGSGGGGWTAPPGYTRRSDNTAGNDAVIAEKLVAVAGAENPGAFSGGGGSGATWIGTIALKP